MAGNVLIKLILDAAGAKEEASGVVKSLDNMEQKASKVVASFQNTIRGRLFNGLTGMMSENVDKLFNRDLPAQLAGAEVTASIASKVAEGVPVIGEALGLIVAKAFEQAKGGNFAGLKGAFGTVQQLQSVFPGTPLAAEDVKSIGRAAFHQHRTNYETNRELRKNFAEGLPSKDFPPFKVKDIKKNLQEAAMVGTQALMAGQALGSEVLGLATGSSE